MRAVVVMNRSAIIAALLASLSLSCATTAADLFQDCSTGNVNACSREQQMCEATKDEGICKQTRQAMADAARYRNANTEDGVEALDLKWCASGKIEYCAALVADANFRLGVAHTMRIAEIQQRGTPYLGTHPQPVSATASQYHKAAMLLHDACEHGWGPACASVGFLGWFGTGVVQQRDQDIRLIGKACFDNTEPHCVADADDSANREYCNTLDRWVACRWFGQLAERTEVPLLVRRQAALLRQASDEASAAQQRSAAEQAERADEAEHDRQRREAQDRQSEENRQSIESTLQQSTQQFQNNMQSIQADQQRAAQISREQNHQQQEAAEQRQHRLRQRAEEDANANCESALGCEENCDGEAGVCDKKCGTHGDIAPCIEACNRTRSLCDKTCGLEACGDRDRPGRGTVVR